MENPGVTKNAGRRFTNICIQITFDNQYIIILKKRVMVNSNMLHSLVKYLDNTISKNVYSIGTTLLGIGPHWHLFNTWPHNVAECPKVLLIIEPGECQR